MFDLSKNSIISFNPQYYTTSHKKPSEKENIYLGGSKIQPKSQKSIKKGINLSKSLSSQKKLSNLNYFKQLNKKPQQNIYYNVTSLTQTLKPKILVNHSLPQIYNFNSLKRSQSSPLIINCPLRTSSRKSENSLCKVKIINGIKNIENSQFYKSAIKPQVNLTQQNFCQSKTGFTQFKPVNHHKNYSPAIKIAQHLNLRQTFNLSPNYKFSNKNSSQNKMAQNISTVYNTLEKHQNVSINSFVPSESTNKTIRPINFKSPVKTSINFTALNQQNNNRLFSEVLKLQNQATQRISQRKLKQSISTAQELSSQQNQNYSQKSQQTIQNFQNKKTQKCSVKSLWDSVDKCTISLICENNEPQSLEDKHSAFGKKVQRTYNELSRFNSLEQFILDNKSAENKKQTLSITQQLPVRNL